MRASAPRTIIPTGLRASAPKPRPRQNVSDGDTERENREGSYTIIALPDAKEDRVNAYEISDSMFPLFFRYTNVFMLRMFTAAASCDAGTGTWY